MILVPLFDLKFLTEVAANAVGTSNRRHWRGAGRLCRHSRIGSRGHRSGSSERASGIPFRLPGFDSRKSEACPYRHETSSNVDGPCGSLHRPPSTSASVRDHPPGARVLVTSQTQPCAFQEIPPSDPSALISRSTRKPPPTVSRHGVETRRAGPKIPGCHGCPSWSSQSRRLPGRPSWPAGPCGSLRAWSKVRGWFFG